jgi:hypothetical protein
MSPKTLTGDELDLNDAPARDAELFLVDGNNLAYRAFFALPEELATSEGFPTNALLGFTNMLFKLLSDYRPKGVAVAWDTRPVHRAAQAEAVEVVYKEGRRPMPDLLREQFPHLRPIVEALTAVLFFVCVAALGPTLAAFKFCLLSASGRQGSLGLCQRFSGLGESDFGLLLIIDPLG